MDVQMRIGNPANRPGREMDEFRPGQIAGKSVFLCVALAHPRFRPRLNFRHGLRHRQPERIDDPLVTRHRMNDRQALRSMEVEIHADHPVSLHPSGQFLPRYRMTVFDQRPEFIGRHVAGNSEQFGRLSKPLAGNFLPLRVVVLPAQPFRIILASRRRAFVRHYPQHPAIIPEPPTPVHR